MVTAPRATDFGGERVEAAESARTRRALALRVAAVVAAILLAYPYSLATLLRQFSLQSPLAYLGLIPFISVILIALRWRAARLEPDIQDRDVDYIIGIGLFVLALAVVAIAPIFLSAYFWLWRLDLLTVPVFVAGAVTIIFGVRSMWRLRLPIAFLVLAWPLPYALLIHEWLPTMAAATNAAVSWAVGWLPVARPSPGPDGALFLVPHGDQTFLVQLPSSGAGVNGIIGFLLVGLAFASLMRGRAVSKATWLLFGVGLIWGLNLAHVLLVFAADGWWGQTSAVRSLDLVLGLVTFGLGVLTLVAVLRFFGLRPRVWRPADRAREREGEAWFVSRRMASRRRPAVGRASIAVAVVLAAAVLAGLTNMQMRQFDLVASDLGSPRVQPFSATVGPIAGWLLHETDTSSAQRYFGEGASWTRYAYTWRSDVPNASPFHSTRPVSLDVISTSDLGSFSKYGLEASYPLHAARTIESQRVALGGGVIGRSVIYRQPNGADWAAVYWDWPVQAPGGQRYERVILSITAGDAQPAGTRATPSPGLQLAIGNFLGGMNGPTADGRLAGTRDFLNGFARQVLLQVATASQRIAGGGAELP
jgi:exosortase/archaeosortase family protein